MPFALNMIVRALVLAFALIAAPALAQNPLSALTGGTAEEAPAEGTPAEDAQTQAAVHTLIEILRDDQRREQLITALEQEAAPAEGAAAPAEETATGEGELLESFGARIAAYTQGFTAQAGRSVNQLWAQLSRSPQLFAALQRADPAIIMDAVLDLVVLVLVTHLFIYALRHLTENFRRRLDARAAISGPFSVALSALVLLAFNAVIVLAAAAAGNLIALFALAPEGEIGLRHSLYLNAFFAVEMAMAVARAVFAPRRDNLRLLRMDVEAARRATGWARVVASLVGYGYLLVVPVFTTSVSWGAGRAVSVIFSLIVLGLATWAVLRLRNRVASRLVAWSGMRAGHSVRLIARYWHVPVLVYLAVLLVVVVTRPQRVLIDILGTTINIALVAFIGFWLADLLARAAHGGIPLPEGLTRRVPLVERRLRAFIPQALGVMRTALLIGIVIYGLNAMGWIDFPAWLDSPFGIRVAEAAVSIALILVIAFFGWLVLSSWVEYRFNDEFGTVATSRERTLLVLFRNAVTVAIVVFTLMFVLSELGLNIAPLLASAGVIGLAIGFGAQKLVQDIITGIFIQLESAIDVGDVVTVAGTSGVVERLTIRSVGLRDLHGVYHIIPFSSVDMVSNFMRGFAYYLCEMGVAYREDTEEVKLAMFDAFAELRRDEEHGPTILEDLEWMGLDRFGDSAVVLRARIKTLPGKQWGVGRAYNAILKRIFDERKIEIPFPHQTIYFGEDKKGKAPPIHVVAEPEPQTEDRTPAPKPRRRKAPKGAKPEGTEIPDDDN